MKHENYLARCIQLAKSGKGAVSPNPLVGCVIVHNDKIIGEGFHQKYGESHAEVNAINAVKDKSLLKESTLYVNLEPCSHFGKTPPCADLIITHQIPKVVVGCLDPNPKVAGQGIAKLKEAGVEVILNVLEAEARELNRRFITCQEKSRPYIILKWAQSSDGFIDIKRTANDKGIAWMSQPETKNLVHQWRSEEDAILVGWKTIAVDNPKLKLRNVKGKNPVRIVIDPFLTLDYTAFHVGDYKSKTIVFTKKQGINSGELLSFVNLRDLYINQILDLLLEQNIQSVIIEGGKTTLLSFINENLWDEARIITGINELKEGVKAPKIKGNLLHDFMYGKDKINIFRND